MKRLFMLLMLVLSMAMASHHALAQEITITLNPGWNWIGYTKAEVTDITTALGGFTPAQGDRIQSQYDYAFYVNGQWRGNLQQFTPGMGYHYYSNRTETVSFVFETDPFVFETDPSLGYISDGLIMILDGIYNTRNGHSTATNVWEDLMGNYDLTVTNYNSYTWEDNHFIGLGNGGYLNTGHSWQYFNSLNNDITIEIVTYIDCDKTNPSYRGLAGWHVNSNGTNFQNDQGSQRMQTLGGLPVSEADDQIATVSYTRNNGSFLNGTWKTNTSSIPNGINSNYTVVFGNSHMQCRGWNDSIYCIRMYNRSLTPEEIAYNHIVDRERFVAESMPQNNVPTGAINSIFSVSDSLQVYFSQGNLQYQATTNTWRFAENQWDCLRLENANISSSYDGWIDLFCWGTSGYDHGATCYQPWSTSQSSSDYYAYGSSEYNLYDQTGKADWGYNAISNGGNAENQWRTLTRDEWSYLLFNRETPSGIRFAKAIVNGIEGLVVLPDNWNSSIYGLQNTNTVSATYTSNIIAENDWTSVLEPHGVLFLPAGSYRCWGSSIENSNKGYYWTSTSLGGGSAGYFEFNNIQDESIGLFVSGRGRDNGLSVRLVRTVQDNSTYTINTTCSPTGGGTVTGAGTYNAGETCTLTASANIGYTFTNWTENGNVVSTNTNYTFTMTANRNLVANFIEYWIGKNLVYNGDFELGNTGFSTDYSYVQGNPGTPSYYYVGHDIAEMWSGHSVGDHTTGEGLFMMIDAGTQPNSTVWEQTVTVMPNTDYVFLAWFLTQNTGYIKFEINGVSGPDMTTPGNRWLWEPRNMTWNSGSSTEATLKIINRYAEMIGYDYCIDDICFWPIGEDNHAYVDLGLPSGLLWATCNVGADNPEDYGDYFAWGETQPKDTYNWSTYQYCMGSNNSMTKYCSNSSYGYNHFTDNLTTLLPEDDAATANWGSDWRMPTKEEFQELYNNTSMTWTTQNGVNGRLFTASNGNSLFLPGAGYRGNSGLICAGGYGSYWSSSLCMDPPIIAWNLYFGSLSYHMYFDYRFYGRSVRPVCSSRQN